MFLSLYKESVPNLQIEKIKTLYQICYEHFSPPYIGAV